MMNGIRSLVLRKSNELISRAALPRNSVHQNTTLLSSLRSLSTTPTTPGDYDTSQFDNFIPTPPLKLSVDMAEGVTDATHFYIKHGVSHQRLKALSNDADMPVAVKWQKMMELFLTTQVHVIAGLGYSANEEGLTKYAHDLAKCMQEADDDVRDTFTELRRDTWRDLVGLAFDLETTQLKNLTIVDARNLMHKVSSKMIEPAILEEIQTRCAELPQHPNEPERMMAEKHKVLQHVIVNTVYLGGNPSMVEEAGFGAGEKGYAGLQYAMSDHEGDPLIMQYAQASMSKVLEAAGVHFTEPPGQGA